MLLNVLKTAAVL